MNINEILEMYFEIYPEEKDYQKLLIDFIEIANNDFYNIKNPKGHMTGSSVVYCASTDSLLLLLHKVLNNWYSPGGHRDLEDSSMIETAKRELLEETMLNNLEIISSCESVEVPFDIDSHIIPENQKNNMPKHYHHDFRYLFIIDKEVEIKIDETESNNYKWVKLKDLEDNNEFKVIIKKIKALTKKIGE